MPRRNSPAPVLLASAAAVALLFSGCGDRATGPSTDEGPDVAASLREKKPRIRIDREAPEYGPGGSRMPASVPSHLVAEIAPGWTAAQINAIWGTTTLAPLPGSSFVLLQMPAGCYYDSLAKALTSYGACTTCDRNFYVESPEAQQGSIAFYEGTLIGSDVADQTALQRVRAAAAQVRATGAGVTVAIVDTGIDGTHPDLSAHVLADGWDFVDNDPDATDFADGLDQDGDGLIDEAAGHGTHVAGIVNAVATDASLLPVRVLDSDGNGTAFDVARGICFARAAGADVINLSLGIRGWSRVIDWAIEEAYAAGSLVVSSAGNAAKGKVDFPARLPEVMGIAALDDAELKAPFSNYGYDVSISAPGVGIVSTYLFHGYAVWSGTSMAAPFVAGAGALALEVAPGISPAQVQAKIELAAADLDHEGRPYDGKMGAGLLDLLPVVIPSTPQ